jgi:translocon-associated protein subunit gamma
MSAATAPTAKKETREFTKEEELLLQDFSRNVSTKSSALFYGNAFIVSVIPICKYEY